MATPIVAPGGTVHEEQSTDAASELQSDEYTCNPGDPDPTPDDPEGDCPAINGGWYCTRKAGHAGQHVAGDGTEVAAVWNGAGFDLQTWSQA